MNIFSFTFRRDAGAVVADLHLDAVAEVLGRGSERGFIIAPGCFGFTLRRRVEAVGDQVEQQPRNILREEIDLAGGWVKRPLQGDIEALLLRPCPMIGEIEALIDQGVDIDRPMLSRPLPRVQQHVLDDRVGALAVLHDLVEIALQHIRDVIDLGTQLTVEVRASKRPSQFINEFDRDRQRNY